MVRVRGNSDSKKEIMNITYKNIKNEKNKLPTEGKGSG